MCIRDRLLYSAFATVVAGSSLSSGLFVPMLVMGSALGRLVGLMLYDVAVGMGYSEASLASGGLSTAGVDPGARDAITRAERGAPSRRSALSYDAAAKRRSHPRRS